MGDDLPRGRQVGLECGLPNPEDALLAGPDLIGRVAVLDLEGRQRSRWRDRLSVLGQPDRLESVAEADADLPSVAVEDDVPVVVVDVAVAVGVDDRAADAGGHPPDLRRIADAVVVAVEPAEVDHHSPGLVVHLLSGEVEDAARLVDDVVVRELEHDAARVRHQVFHQAWEDRVVGEEDGAAVRHEWAEIEP